MANIKWRASKGKVWQVLNTDLELDGTTSSYMAQVTAATAEVEMTAYLKDVTITPPEMEVELVNTMGEDSNGFQNSYEEEKPSTMATLTATLIMQGDEIFETGMTSAAGATGYSDYIFNANKRDNKSYVVNFDDTVDEISVVFYNSYVKLGERKPTGMDGHWEQSIELKVSPQGYREQFKD